MRDSDIILSQLRSAMADQGLDVFILPRTDAYLNEFIAPDDECLSQVSNFSGSSGIAVIGQDNAYLLTDGRYLLQAAQQANPAIWTIHDIQKCDLAKTLLTMPNTKNSHSVTIGYDPRLHSQKDMLRVVHELPEQKFHWREVTQDFLNICRPHKDSDKSFGWEPISILNANVHGCAAQEKIERIRRDIQLQGIDGVLIARPDSVCWALNARGFDTPHVPVVLSRLLVLADQVIWFVPPVRVPDSMRKNLPSGLVFMPPETIAEVFRSLPAGFVLGLDPARTPCVFYQMAKHLKIMDIKDPCIDLRAIKTIQEQESMRAAHRVDGLAVARLLEWVAQTPDLDEHRVAEHSRIIRAEMSSHFQELSFSTIAGFNANGAIIHYRPPETGSAKIQGNGLLLIDSGGQYCGPDFAGTTDVTRTIALGTPQPEHIRHYTLVLRAHIAVASARFPQGTTGAQIDALARRVLWDACLDYAHGTGHGVGCYLNVHEEAASLSPRGTEPLRAGMILSNEPGYYQEGSYGIRIENLLLVLDTGDVDSLGRAVLAFEDLTRVPYDDRLIDRSLLTPAEKNWLAAYDSAGNSVGTE